jgi:hypothetical protein
MKKRTRRASKNNDAISIVATVAALGMSLGVVPGEIFAADSDQPKDSANAPGAMQYKDKAAGAEYLKSPAPGAMQYKDKAAGAEYLKSPAPGAMQYKDKAAGAEYLKSPAPGAMQYKDKAAGAEYLKSPADAPGAKNVKVLTDQPNAAVNAPGAKQIKEKKTPDTFKFETDAPKDTR